MKFEGSLDAFSLPDIFQLLSYTKKSGALRLRHGRSEGVVHFRDGAVTGAASDVSHQALARRVAVTGLSSADDFRSALDRAQESGGRVGVVRVLLDSNSVDRDTLARTAEAHVVDAVSELLRWDAGSFRFVEIDNPDDVGIALPTDVLVSDAEARRTAFEQLAAVVPSPDLVPVVRPVSPAEGVSLSADEWSILALVDGRRSVGAIVALTGRGLFSVVSTLAELVQRDVLQLRAADEAPADVDDMLLALTAFEQSTEVTDWDTEDDPDSMAPAPPALHRPTAVPAPAAVREPEPQPAAEPEREPERAEQPEPTADRRPLEPVASADGPELMPRLGGAHVPQNVVPPRPEPYLPNRQPDHPESAPPPRTSTTVAGSAAVATDPQTSALIERDPSVNRSLMLRLIAGVRGL